MTPSSGIRLIQFFREIQDDVAGDYLVLFASVKIFPQGFLVKRQQMHPQDPLSFQSGIGLDILNHSNDGFFIAGEDLRLRGPGDLFGIRQSGIMNFKLGDVFQDSVILKQAAEAAGEMLGKDPELRNPEYTRLSSALERYITDQNLEATL